MQDNNGCEQLNSLDIYSLLQILQTDFNLFQKESAFSVVILIKQGSRKVIRQ